MIVCGVWQYKVGELIFFVNNLETRRSSLYSSFCLSCTFSAEPDINQTIDTSDSDNVNIFNIMSRIILKTLSAEEHGKR